MKLRVILFIWVIFIFCALVVFLGHGGMEPEQAIIPVLNTAAIIVRSILVLCWPFFTLGSFAYCVSVIIRRKNLNIQKTQVYFWAVLSIAPAIVGALLLALYD